MIDWKDSGFVIFPRRLFSPIRQLYSKMLPSTFDNLVLCFVRVGVFYFCLLFLEGNKYIIFNFTPNALLEFTTNVGLFAFHWEV